MAVVVVWRSCGGGGDHRNYIVSKYRFLYLKDKNQFLSQENFICYIMLQINSHSIFLTSILLSHNDFI